MTLRDSLIRAAKAYRRAELASEGAVVSYAERIDSGKPGSSHLTFAGDLPLSVEMERFYARAAEYWERRTGATSPPEGLRADSRSDASKARTRAVLSERGIDPTAAAFIYGMTTQGVRNLRGRHGLDPDTGLRVSELRSERIDGEPSTRVPLTAPPRAAMDTLEAQQEECES